MKFRERLLSESTQRQVIVEGQVTPDSSRCVQCGICTYNCPIGIDVRRHAWLGEPIIDSHCLTCGECIARCPRAVLRFEKSMIFTSTGDFVRKTKIDGSQKVVENV